MSNVTGFTRHLHQRVTRHLHRRRPRHRRAPIAVLALAFTAALTTTGATVPKADPVTGPLKAAAAESSRGGQSSPQVVHTGKGPTGYEVTFRFKDRDATSVKIKGNWYFTNPNELPALTSGPEENVQTTGTLPEDWEPGDIPISYPNSSFSQWPVTEMTRQKDGVWTHTTPLPSGIFTYSFLVDCDSETGEDCEGVADPQNLPWNQTGDGVTGTQVNSSQVYVPSDPKFGTVDYSWQGPSPRKGTLTNLTFPSSTSVPPADHAYITVYTPWGYDPNREKPYPTVYMFTGGDNEMDWTTAGDLANILDNLIATGEIQPMVVVQPSDLGELQDYDGFPEFTSNLLNTIIPWVESRYNVSTDPTRRAAAGQGFGGSIANSLLFNHPDAFGYFGVMSPGSRANFRTPDPSTVTEDQIAAMTTKGVFVGGGYQEPSVTPFGSTHGGHYYHAQAVKTFVELGVPVTPDFVNGGHDMYTWRLTVRDFLTKVAFRPLATG